MSRKSRKVILGFAKVPWRDTMSRGGTEEEEEEFIVPQ